MPILASVDPASSFDIKGHGISPQLDVYTLFVSWTRACSPPLPWHLQAWNIGTCAYMIWTAIGCFIPVMFAPHSKEDSSNETFLATHITTGLNVSIPVSMLCISRRLYYIATLDPLKRTIKQRHREMIFDLSLCILVPVAQAVVVSLRRIKVTSRRYIVHPQGRRYDIYENLGCHNDILNTWVALLLFSSWPVILGFISAVYSVLNLILFRKRQKNFNRCFCPPRSDSRPLYALDVHSDRRYRLMVPITLYVFCINAANLSPWISWEQTHSAFSVIYVYPASVWQPGVGFASERSTCHYRRALGAVLPSCGLSLRKEYGNSGEDDTVRTEIGFTPVKGNGNRESVVTEEALEPVYQNQRSIILSASASPLAAISPPPVYYPEYRLKTLKRSAPLTEPSRAIYRFCALPLGTVARMYYPEHRLKISTPICYTYPQFTIRPTHLGPNLNAQLSLSKNRHINLAFKFRPSPLILGNTSTTPGADVSCARIVNTSWCASSLAIFANVSAASMPSTFMDESSVGTVSIGVDPNAWKCFAETDEFMMWSGHGKRGVMKEGWTQITLHKRAFLNVG
ncbi:STE3-domain-containing protein [Hymenopellis radicata]|nr:STE3-domain-containing protein [Hymenopellis radicata]